MYESIVLFVSQWYGMLSIVLFGIIYFSLTGWHNFKDLLVRLIFIAEEWSRGQVLETGQEKMAFVIERAISIMPFYVKSTLTLLASLSGQTLEQYLQGVIQKIFDKLKQWGEIQVRKSDTTEIS